MATTEDDRSEYSEELGVAYDRIEYPREVYDRVCGRLSVKHPPLAKKQKVKDWLSDSQTSQATLISQSKAPQRARKRKSKQSNDSTYVPFTEESKKSAPTKKKTDKKITRKALKLRGISKKVNIESDEESSGTTEDEEDEDYSESDSSSENKKKKGSSLSKSQRDQSENAKKEQKIRVKTEKSMGDLKRSVHNEFRGEKTRLRTEKPKEDLKRSSHNDFKQEKTSTADVKKERKEVNVARVEKRSEEERGSDIKDPSLGGKKSTHSSKEVPWNESKTGFEVSRASSQSSSVLLHRKSILKNKSTSKTKSSDDSVLPSSLQQLFNGVSSSSRTLSLVSTFRVPKKKYTRDDRVVKKTEGPSVLMDKSKEIEGGNGWDPRDDAFVPPPRNFRKPLLKTPIGVERRKTFDIQRQPEIKSSPLLLGRPISYETKDPFEEESWKKMDVPMDPMTSLGPCVSSHPSDPFYSLPDSDKTVALAAAFTPKRSIPFKSIVGTPFPHNRSIESHKHFFPTPKWTEGRETDYSMMEKRGERRPIHEGDEEMSSCDWMPMESNESTRRRNSRWDTKSPPSGYKNQDAVHSPMDGNTPMSPPPSASSPLNDDPSIDSSTPTMIPIESTTVRYKFIPIDDGCLPHWNRSDRYEPTSALYSASSPGHKYEAMIVVGPIYDDVYSCKERFEKILTSKGTEVEWAEAPPTKDAKAKRARRMAVVLCYSERTAKSLLADRTFKFGKLLLPVGRPAEVLVRIEGLVEIFNKNMLIEKATSVIEDECGPLVELLLFPIQNLVVKGKVRFFYAVHGSRAVHRTLDMGRGGSISFAPCPPEESTIWVAQIHSPMPEDMRSLARLSSTLPSPSPFPSSPTVLPSPSNLSDPSHPQPVPSPSIVSLSTPFGSIKKEISTTVSTSNVSLPSLMSLTSLTSLIPQDDNMGWSNKEDVPCVKKEVVSPSPSPSFSLFPPPSSSKFSSLPPPTAIPPPGLIDPSMLRLVIKGGDESRVYNQHLSLSIPPISVPGSLIPLPPTPIPPPIDMIPILPYPDLPPIDHVFFQPPPPEKRRSNQRRELKKIDPATFIKPFEALLPKGKEGEKDDKEDDEILLFARPMDIEPQQTDWDAVREYFKDDECSSRIYGGVISLRLSGRKSREKAQVLLLEGPHTVNGQKFAIGLTYSVLFEATRAVGKTRLYDEVMERFGSVVEVEKKGDTHSGNPVYKIYFDKLEKAQSAASEGITVGESILSNIGRIPQ